MRVIAGTLGGRTFESPNSFKTHPMSEKMRGAIFNALGDISGLTVLDAFAGSGALSFEAMSRGALHVTTIDSDKAAQKAIEANLRALKLSKQVANIKASASAWLGTNDGKQFDIVFCDPPYNDLQPELLEKLANAVKHGGLFVLSWPTAVTDVPDFKNLELVSQRAHGDATAYFYKAV